jgi:beta-lactamase superfamily II metal-dependent hydrolase
MVTNGSNVTVASAGTSTIDTLFANTYSSAKYTITAVLQNTNIREINEVLLVHNGDASSAGTATVLSYGKINTAGNTLVTFGATTSGNIAILQATTTNANTIFRIKRDYQAL